MKRFTLLLTFISLVLFNNNFVFARSTNTISPFITETLAGEIRQGCTSDPNCGSTTFRDRYCLICDTSATPDPYCRNRCELQPINTVCAGNNTCVAPAPTPNLAPNSLSPSFQGGIKPPGYR